MAELIVVGRLEAARRQLQTAITLWFNEGDEVSIHTLAYAAYEIIHVVSKKRNPNRHDLLFDASFIKDEYRGEVNKFYKKPGSFFKHANKDGEVTVEFTPLLTQLFLICAVVGVQYCNEKHNEEEDAFMQWLYIQRPDLLSDEWSKLLEQSISVELMASMRTIPRNEFLQTYKDARALVRRI